MLVYNVKGSIDYIAVQSSRAERLPKDCLDETELVLDRLEVDRKRFCCVLWASPRGVRGMAGFLLPSPLPLVLCPNLLIFLLKAHHYYSRFCIVVTS